MNMYIMCEWQLLAVITLMQTRRIVCSRTNLGANSTRVQLVGRGWSFVSSYRAALSIIWPCRAICISWPVDRWYVVSPSPSSSSKSGELSVQSQWLAMILHNCIAAAGHGLSCLLATRPTHPGSARRGVGLAGRRKDLMTIAATVTGAAAQI